MTLKQQIFVKKYFKYGGNATKAVLDTYSVKSNNSASVIGSNLLRNVKVKSEINRIIEADRTFLPYVIDALRKFIENGKPYEKLEAIKLGFKLYGYE